MALNPLRIRHRQPIIIFTLIASHLFPLLIDVGPAFAKLLGRHGLIRAVQRFQHSHPHVGIF